MSMELKYTCDVCSGAVGAGKGVVAIAGADVSASQRWDDGHEPGDEDDPGVARWSVKHLDCRDEETADEMYSLDVEQLHDTTALLAWTLHLVSKSWVVPHTDWLSWAAGVCVASGVSLPLRSS